MCRIKPCIEYKPCGCTFFNSTPDYCEDFKKNHKWRDGSLPTIAAEGYQPRLEKCYDPGHPSIQLRMEYEDEGRFYEQWTFHRIIYERSEHNYPWWTCQERLCEVVNVKEEDCPFHEWLRADESWEREQTKRDEEQKKKEKWEKSLLGKGEKLWKLRHEFEWGI